MTDPAAPWLLTTDGARIADVRVLWTLPAPDVAALRAVVADVRRRERERRAVAQRGDVRNTD
jgi:hypothetical protein